MSNSAVGWRWYPNRKLVATNQGKYDCCVQSALDLIHLHCNLSAVDRLKQFHEVGETKTN